MPAPGSYGFQPKKVTLSNLGGGGPDFGSDFSGYRPAVTQPVHVQTGGRGPQHNAEMLNRVQESLDNISLSPRTPDYYQVGRGAGHSLGWSALVHAIQFKEWIVHKPSHSNGSFHFAHALVESYCKSKVICVMASFKIVYFFIFL